VDGLQRELVISTGMVLFTVLTHLIGLSVLVHLTRIHITKFATTVQMDRILVPLGMVLGLFMIHGIEIWTYAMVYFLSGIAHGIEPALYLSIGAYTTNGWVDIHLPPGWRIVLSLEGVNGLLLVGWSTAYLFQNLNRVMLTEESHPLPEGAIARIRRKVGV
jgi:hypothetical protein